MMNAKVRELLNDQINKELYSAYLYLDFSNYFEERGLNGFGLNVYMRVNFQKNYIKFTNIEVIKIKQ